MSIPSIILQIDARWRFDAAHTFRFDAFTVSMAHPDALASLFGGTVAAHFSSLSFHQREMKMPGMRTIMNSD